MKLKELAQLILDTHHADMKAKVPPLAAKIEALRNQKKGDEQVERLYRSFFRLKADIESHLWKEEMILFPMIMQMDESGSAPTGCGIQGPVTQMNHEHAEVKLMLAEITDATKRIGGLDPEITTGCDWVNTDLYEHIRKEEEELFPGALKACGATLSA